MGRYATLGGNRPVFWRSLQLLGAYLQLGNSIPVALNEVRLGLSMARLGWRDWFIRRPDARLAQHNPRLVCLQFWDAFAEAYAEGDTLSGFMGLHGFPGDLVDQIVAAEAAGTLPAALAALPIPQPALPVWGDAASACADGLGAEPSDRPVSRFGQLLLERACLYRADGLVIGEPPAPITISEGGFPLAEGAAPPPLPALEFDGLAVAVTADSSLTNCYLVRQSQAYLTASVPGVLAAMLRRRLQALVGVPYWAPSAAGTCALSLCGFDQTLHLRVDSAAPSVVLEFADLELAARAAERYLVAEGAEVVGWAAGTDPDIVSSPAFGFLLAGLLDAIAAKADRVYGVFLKREQLEQALAANHWQPDALDSAESTAERLEEAVAQAKLLSQGGQIVATAAGAVVATRTLPGLVPLWDAIVAVARHQAADGSLCVQLADGRRFNITTIDDSQYDFELSVAQVSSSADA